MTRIYTENGPVRLTVRQEVRLALVTRRPMIDIERDLYRSLISGQAYERFVRIWSMTSATSAPGSKNERYDRWFARREKMISIVKTFIHNTTPEIVLQNIKSGAAQRGKERGEGLLG